MAENPFAREYAHAAANIRSYTHEARRQMLEDAGAMAIVIHAQTNPDWLKALGEFSILSAMVFTFSQMAEHLEIYPDEQIAAMFEMFSEMVEGASQRGVIIDLAFPIGN